MRNLEFLVVGREPVPPCPFCNGTLHYRDSRKRIRRREGGVRESLQIRRFRCENCKAHHNELPDCLVPYKHYDAETISGVLDDVLHSEDLDCEDRPTAETMLWWCRWFLWNLPNIEGLLRKAALQLGNCMEAHSTSVLKMLRSRYPDWLEKTLRIIYNSGGWLPSCRSK